MTKSLEEQIANECRYFNGIGSEFCEAGVRISDVISFSHRRPSMHPCFKENNISFFCTKCSFYTEEEVQQEVRKINALFDRTVQDIQNDICPTCRLKIALKRQVGRCVYADPCGHRLYQGHV